MGPVVTPSSRDLVGRDAELDELCALLGVRAAGHTTGTAVLLGGDAGVGKTRLLTALRDVAQAEGWRVVAGHCLDLGDAALPYLPFTEVLGRLATELPDVVAEAAAAHPALTRLQAGRRMLDDPATAELGRTLGRGDLLEALHGLLEAAARRGPLLLVVEDLHWADQSTRDVLSLLLTRGFAGPVAVVGSYRADDLHRRHPLRRQVAEWGRLGGVARLHLGPLDEPAVRALVDALQGAAAVGTGRGAGPQDGPDGPRIPEAGVADIVACAEGNAFFVEELVGAASGAGRWQPDQWLPDDLADLLLVRLDRLDDTARQVVRTASVSGRRVGHEMLLATAGLDAAALDEGLRGAVEMNVLVADRGEYAFRHALLAEAVYDDLLPGERVRLHAAYAAALRDGTVRGTAAELARHARLALDLDTAWEASVRAGREAARVGGPDEAAQHFSTALELLAARGGPDGRGLYAALREVDVSKLAVEAGDALHAAGHPARAAALVAEQLERLPPEAPDAWRARLLSARATYLYVVDTEEDLLALSRRALELVPPDAGGLRARVLAAHARILAGHDRFEEAQAHGLEALALAERLDLGELASEAVTTVAGLRNAPPETLRAALQRAVKRARAAGAVNAELRGRFLLARSWEDHAEYDEAARLFAGTMARAQEERVPWAPYAFEARWQLAWIHVVAGRWDEALALLDTTGQAPPPVPEAMLEAVRLALLQARGDDVAERARRLRPLWQEEGAVAIHAAAVEMLCAARSGDARAVLATYDAAVDVLSRVWHPWLNARIRLAAVALGGLADCAPRLAAAEREALAPEVERLLRDGHTVLLRHSDPAGHWGPEGQAWSKRLDAEALRCRWLTGVDAPPEDVLVEVWRETASLFEDAGHVHDLARVRAVLAGVLRATGDAAGARVQADLARAAAEALGARPLLAELRAAGGGAPRTGTPADEVALTAREREILALVAQGRTNGEVGRLLFISTKTVSVHVSNILAKLGAASRTEAAAVARRRGLVD